MFCFRVSVSSGAWSRRMRLFYILAVTSLWSYLAWASPDISCSSCGFECMGACGTKNFRACCFNFQRRRKSTLPAKILEGPDSKRDFPRTERNFLPAAEISGISPPFGKTQNNKEPPEMETYWFHGRTKFLPKPYPDDDSHRKDGRLWFVTRIKEMRL